MIELTEEQQKAIDQIVEWYKNPQKKQPFILAGYAGCGKTTVVKYIVEALGLRDGDVAIMAPTAKAALVLRKKGVNADTVHSRIYKAIYHGYSDPVTGIKKQKLMGFSLRTELKEALRLLIVDEFSMIGDDIYQDLIKLRIPIIGVGDPAQLPPVSKNTLQLLDNPNVLLTQIHRHLEDNPILWASMLIRNGKLPPYGVHGEQLKVIKREDLNSDDLLQADQILACTHRWRIFFNQKMRTLLGFEGELPQLGERLVCLKNKRDTVSNGVHLTNGLMFKVIKEPFDVNEIDRTLKMSLAFEDDITVKFDNLLCDLDWYTPLEGVKPDLDSIKVCYTTYGYCCTVHASQGNEFDRVLFVGDVFNTPNQPDLKRKLMYTAVTRSINYCTLIL